MAYAVPPGSSVSCRRSPHGWRALVLAASSAQQIPWPSQNPMPDNGIKFFARGGHKLADALEDRIEARLRDDWQRPTGGDVGRITPLADGADRYVAHLLSVLPHRLEGLHVVVDAAHGAA